MLADTATLRDLHRNRALAAYQADLAGRPWRVDLTTSSSTAEILYSAGTSQPMDSAPAVAQVDTSTAVIVAVGGSFDDPDNNLPTSAVPEVQVLFEAGGSLNSSATYSKQLTDLCADQRHAGDLSGCTKFAAAARDSLSPVLLRNQASGAEPLQAVMMVYQPQGDSCAPGYSSLVVLDINGTSVTQREPYRLTAEGKAAGASLTAGGQILVGTSGLGAVSSGVSVVAGQAVVTPPSSTSSSYGARVLGVAEVSE